MLLRYVLSSAAVAALVSLVARPHLASVAAQAGSARETVLFEVPSEFDERSVVGHFASSADGRRVAVVVRRGGKWSILGRGWTLPAGEYEVVSGIQPSPDGTRFAATAKSGTWRLIVDGVEQAEYDQIKGVRFSPDSRALSYAAARGTVWHLVRNGREAGEYQDLGWLQYGRDSSRFAYTAKRRDRWVLVVDGTEGPEWDEVSSPTFLPDGRRPAYTGKRGKQWWVVIDGREVGPFANVNDLVFTSDGGRWGYFAQPQRVDPAPKVEYITSRSSIRQKLKQPDHVFLLKTGARMQSGVAWWVLHLDDSTVGGPTAAIAGPIFDSTGSRAFHLAGDEVVVGLYLNGRKLIDLTTHEPGSEEHLGVLRLEQLAATSDGSRIAVAISTLDPGMFPTRHVRAVTIEVDAMNGSARTREGPWYKGAGIREIQFSPNGRHFAYVLLQGKEQSVVVDSSPGPSFDEVISSLRLSDDSATYFVRRGRTFSMVSQALLAR